MVRVHLEGEKWLPPSIDTMRLAEATVRVGEMLGIHGTIALVISPHFSKCRGQAEINGGVRITLFDKFIRQNAKERGWTLRYLYSCTLAHELVHAAQHARRSHGLKTKASEAEAWALEDAYGPEAQQILERE